MTRKQLDISEEAARKLRILAASELTTQADIVEKAVMQYSSADSSKAMRNVSKSDSMGNAIALLMPELREMAGEFFDDKPDIDIAIAVFNYGMIEFYKGHSLKIELRRDTNGQLFISSMEEIEQDESDDSEEINQKMRFVEAESE